MPIAPNDLDALTRDFERLRRQKHRKSGGVEARVLQNLCFYYGEHYIEQRADALVQNTLDAEKLHLVFNLVKKHFRQKLGRLSAIGMRFGASPNTSDPRALAQAEPVDKLILALDRKVGQAMRTWETYWWVLLGGVAIEHTAWIPDSTTEPVPAYSEETGALIWIDREADGAEIDEAQMTALVEQGRAPESFEIKQEMQRTGDVGSKIFGPLNVFVDAATRSLQDLPPGQFVYLAEIKTLDWVIKMFGPEMAEQAKGGRLSIIKTGLRSPGPSVSGMNIKDLIPAIQGTQGPDDPDMALFVTGYSPPSDEFPMGREVFFTPGQVVYADRANPYEELPLVDTHFDPAATSFWSPDFVTDLVPGNKFLNKRMSQLGEQANASIYDLVLLGPNLTAADIPTDYPGYVEGGIDDQGHLNVARVPGPSLPGWFMNSIELTIQFLQEAGGADLMSQKNFPGQLRGPTAVPLIQELLDSEDGPLYIHLGEQAAHVKQQRLNRVKQFYPAVRTLNYAGRGLRDEVLIFHASDILRAGTDFSITVDRRSLVPELSALREARVRERLNGPLQILYLDPRTGQLDASKIAEDLNGYDLERETKVAQGRKFAKVLVDRLFRAEPVEPPLPFYPHAAMMDEFEAAMLTTEWHSASPAIRNAFITQWNFHRDALQKQADQQAQAMQAQALQSAVAQATQQVAAQTAAATVEAAQGQIDANLTAATGPPSTADTIRQALQGAESAQTPPGPNGVPPGPQAVQ